MSDDRQGRVLPDAAVHLGIAPRRINATIVHADTLRHPSIPQPDGGRIYRCLKEFPGRRNGTLVPLSTLTHELDGGALWPQIGDWERVTDAIVQLSRRRGCDALPLGLSPPCSQPSPSQTGRRRP